MESGRCRDCRWWEQDEISPDYQAADDIALVQEPASWGLCALTMSQRDMPVHDQSKAFAAQGDYESAERPAALVTAPEFGCVQFQPHEGRVTT
jgi:hypothetical protein